MGGSAISVRGLGKCYRLYSRPQDRLKQALWRGRRRYYDEFWALRDVDLEVGRGEAVGIVGRNGSGKSTLLHLIAGTLQPTEGEVRVRGRVSALLELGSGFNPEFSGRENVFLSGSLFGRSRRDMQRRFDAIADFAGIGAFIDRPTKTYSSGMFVRLAFAVAVHLDPEILIVDEALAVGDMLFQHQCMARIRALSREGVTLVFVSHNPDTLRPGSAFHLEVCVRSNVEIPDASVGFVIKDHLGIELTGESVFNAFRRGVTLKPGDPWRVRFSGANNLREGEYSVSLRVHRVRRWDRSDKVLLYQDETALAFRVLGDPDRVMWFRYRHPFQVSFP